MEKNKTIGDQGFDIESEDKRSQDSATYYGWLQLKELGYTKKRVAEMNEMSEKELQALIDQYEPKEVD